MIRVLFFGRFGDLAGSGQREMELSPAVSDIAGLADAIGSSDPALGEALLEPRVMVSVNQTLVDWHTVIGDGDEVAFLPPVTGG